ncbi:hypothetical protein [Novosphingobium sp. ERW19]|uniref:hypothetical protein n=1 Tax=Novosphingobium sp. ERW19 TaxID=2726186 RepID=UPI0019800190|nr:hypothetical protein [Novosphingobium sp. ERW19]
MRGWLAVTKLEAEDLDTKEIANIPQLPHSFSMSCQSRNGSEGAWWQPCNQVAGFRLGVPIEDYDDFRSLHCLVESADEIGSEIFDSRDGSYTVFVKDRFVTGFSSHTHFLIGDENIIGMHSVDAVAVILKYFGLEKSAAVHDQCWVEVSKGVQQRFINFDDICLFLTEDASLTIITADAYGGD